MTTHAHGLGWKKDPHDPKDRIMAAPPGLTRLIERRMDHLCSAIRDQFVTAACTGHTLVEGIEVLFALEGHGGIRLSPWHAYWLGRAIDGFQREDQGAFIRSLIKAATKTGVCSEHEWPYAPERINIRPPMSAELSGVKYAGLSYERVIGGAEHVLDALQIGRPVIFGTMVGNVFMDALGEDTIPAPSKTEVMLGGHALLAAGFDRSGERVRVQNSWGTWWGDKGMCWMAAEWFDSPNTNDIWALVPHPSPSVST